MKRKITLLMLAASSVLTMSSQVLLQEGFTSPFTPAAAGWVATNLSQPLGTQSWQQGNSATYSSYDGGVNDYFSANFNSAGSPSVAGISNWLITPAVTIYNGAVLQFATKTINQGAGNPNFSPDRLQVRMANVNNTAIGAGSVAVGAFTNLLFELNPNQITSTISAVTNGTMVNGYPNVWTVYSITITGVTGTITAGRFAFRYFVEDAGPQGNNSNNIGLDAVKYTLPCQATAVSFTTCANQPVTLTANGILPTTTYSWSGPSGYNSTSAIITVTAPPAGVAVYTLDPAINGTLCGTPSQVSITVSGNLSMQVSATSTNVCSGSNVTLTATSSANNYAWAAGGNPLGNTPSIVVTPTAASTTYSVGGTSGAFPNLCSGGATIAVITRTLPVITFSQTNQACSTQSFALVAGGGTGQNYVWFGVFGTITGTNTLPLTAGTATGANTFTVFGQGPNGCLAGIASTFTVFPTPTVAVVASQTPACRAGGVDITGSGAATYSWSGAGIAASSTMNPLSFSTGTASGSRTIVVAGVSANGCAGTSTYVLGTVICPGIETRAGSGEAAIYPNPFTNELKVVGILGNIEIYNTLGQIVIKATLRNESETIDTTELPKGAYILKSYNKDGDNVKTVKLLKN